MDMVKPAVRENGQSTPATEQKKIISYNPATGQANGEVIAAATADVASIMERARKAQTLWAARPLDERVEILKQVKRAFYNHHEDILAVMVNEQGRTTHEADVAEYLPTLAMLDYYIRRAPKILKSRKVFVWPLAYRRHLITRKPHGTVLVIAPWNFPIYLSMAPIATALVAGNAVIFKPSEFATQSGELIKRILYEGQVPEDVFQVVHGYGDVGAALIDAHPDKICFTGSEATGRKIAAKAGQMLIPVTLELGGKDAALVMEDANLKRTAQGLVWGGTLIAGQACVSVERVYVVQSVAEKLIQEMKAVIEKHVHPGPGNQTASTYGAITTEAQLKIIEAQVEEAKQQGARIVTGGKRMDLAGRFYAPTVITDVRDDMAVVKDETFGPVIVVVSVEDEAEAIRRSNESIYGLTASVWTEDRQRGKRIAAKLQVGVTSVNDHITSMNAPHMPWGGVKATGYGRTRSHEGLLEMTTAHGFSTERIRLPFEPFWLPYTAWKRSLIRRFTHLWYGPTWQDKLKAFRLRV